MGQQTSTFWNYFTLSHVDLKKYSQNYVIEKKFIMSILWKYLFIGTNQTMFLKWYLSAICTCSTARMILIKFVM